jgi:hypothetical protein
MITVESIARQVVEACEAEDVPHMVTGAFAFNYYGIPRSTKDVDLVVDVTGSKKIEAILGRLEPHIDFGAQVQFDTLTWGRRHIGQPKGHTQLQVELFELFDDPFVQAQFQRRRRLFCDQLDLHTWLPTAEDLIVQKLRWGRSKDLDDVRDVLAVQGPETLDMSYIERWCATHGTSQRLKDILESLPPL